MEKIAVDFEYPKIRPVEAFPVETQHGRMIGLRDPQGIASNTLVLSPDIFYLLQFFDGQHSKQELRQEYVRAFGQFLYEEQLAHILSNLDSQLFLDNQSYQQKHKSIENEFAALRVRPAAHAGVSYEADAAKLRTQLESFFTSPDGAGLPNPKKRAKKITGLIAPHIDLRAGGPCYSHAYKALAESVAADCYVILGTGHTGLRNLYSAFAKDFVTPLGEVRCDIEFIQMLWSNSASDFSGDVLAHKTEHTIEFQLLFLQYLFQARRAFTFVPILCSFSYDVLNAAPMTRERQIIDDFTTALRKTISHFGKKVCLIASVDLSHVGPRYGDQHSSDMNFISQVHQADRELLACVEKLDTEGFYSRVASQRDRYRVCGFAPIYTLLKVIDSREGKLLNYTEAKVDEQNSMVTFASMVFY